MEQRMFRIVQTIMMIMSMMVVTVVVVVIVSVSMIVCMGMTMGTRRLPAAYLPCDSARSDYCDHDS